jgi:hypothetical protein
MAVTAQTKDSPVGCAEEYWRRVAQHDLWKTEEGVEQFVEQEAADCAQ